MSYEERDIYGMYKNQDGKGPGPRLMGADTLIGNDVYNHKDEELGDIKEIMLDLHSGKIAYAVWSFGGFLGMADKLFAVPWSTLDSIPRTSVSCLMWRNHTLNLPPDSIRMTGRIWRTPSGKIQLLHTTEQNLIRKEHPMMIQAPI